MRTRFVEKLGWFCSPSVGFGGGPRTSKVPVPDSGSFGPGPDWEEARTPAYLRRRSERT